MKYIECLGSYVPGLIVDRLITDCDKGVRVTMPWRQKYETVCLFCDVSGFTALSEAMSINGKGAEGLAKHLNSYFSQMLRLIAADGGDVFKFAGDAIIVLWPEYLEDTETMVRRAAQCACAIQQNLDNSLMEEGVRLSVKIGIGFGSISVLHIGGVYGRVEYVAVGEPLTQAFNAEHKCTSGQVICSREVWGYLSEYFVTDCLFPDGYARINLDAKPKLVRKIGKMNMLRTNISDSDKNLETRIKAYVPGAVSLNADSPEDEHWGNEVRTCTVLFVNLGLKEQHILAASVYDEAMVQVHEVLVETQKAVYQYEGSINKFLVDDKGSTLVACFGLPPVSHDDDAVRGVLASLNLCERLQNLGLVASVGITTGDMFCGVVGSNTRREYTVLGDCVNTAARFMQKAMTDGGGVLCDENTFLSCERILNFEQLENVKLKGKSGAVKCFRPYPKFSGSTRTYIQSGLSTIRSNSGNLKSKFHVMHIQQLQNAAVNRALHSIQSYFYERALISTKYSHQSQKGKIKRSELTTTNPRKQSNVFNFSSAIRSESIDRDSKSLTISTSAAYDDNSSKDGTSSPDGGQARRPSLGRKSTFIAEDEASVMLKKKPRRPSLQPLGTSTSQSETIVSPAAATEDVSTFLSIYDQHQSATTPKSNAAQAGLVSYMRRGSAVIKARSTNGGEDAPVIRAAPGSPRGSPRPFDYSEVMPAAPDSPVVRRSRAMSESSPDVAENTRDSIKKPRSLTRVSEYVGASDFITVVVPDDLNMENLHDLSPTIFKNCPLNMFYTFDHLFDHVLEEAVNLGVLPTHTTVHDIALSVAGTRFFIPNSSNFNIRWLALFISAARGRLYDSIPYEVANELALTKMTNMSRVQSRTSLSIRKLLERAIFLADHDEGSVIMMEGDAGVGKSEIISSYISQLQQLHMLVIYTTSSAYSDDPLGPFSVVLQQLLDKRAGELKISRTDVLRNIVKSIPDLEPDGPLLDRPLGTRLRYVHGDATPREKSRRMAKFNVGEPLVGRSKSFLEENDNDYGAGSDDEEEEDELVSAYNVLEHLSEVEKNARRLRLYFCIFKYFAHTCPTCVIIDDAHFLDEESWALCLLLALALEGDNAAIEKIVGADSNSHVLFPNPKLILLLSFRPLLSYRPIFRPPAEIYMLLVETPKVVFLKIEGLPSEEVDQLIVSKLGSNVRGVADDLFLLAETKCMGNPWMIIELINTLMASSPPSIVFKEKRNDNLDESIHKDGTATTSHPAGSPLGVKSAPRESRRGSYAISPMGTPEYNMDVCVFLTENFQFDQCPLPKSVAKAFGARVDRLNSCQVTILKTAALIGQQFKWSYLYNCYPVENHKHRLLKELDRLLMLGFIVELPREEATIGVALSSSGSSSAPGGDRTFFFLSAFLVDVLKTRMIREHRETIQTAIFREKNMIEATQRRLFMQKAHLPVGSGDILSGNLLVQKKITNSFFTLRIKRRIQGGDWKPRFCVLRKDRFSMYRDKSHFDTSPGTPTQIIFLDESVTELEKSDDHQGKPNVFRIDTHRYIRETVEFCERRSFIFSAPTSADAERWVYMVRYAVELPQEEAPDSPIASVLNLEYPKNPSPSRRKSGNFDNVKRRKSFGDEKVQAQLDEAHDAIKNIDSTSPTSSLSLKKKMQAIIEDIPDADAYLCIYVGCARNLRPMEVYGICNRYVVCTVDKEKRRTEMSTGSPNEPFWGKLLVIPITMSQWANSNVVVNVWNKEFLLTDDFLGQIRVDLKSVEVNDSDDLPTNLGFESPEEARAEDWKTLIVGNRGDSADRTNALMNPSPMTGRALSGGNQGFGFFPDDYASNALGRLSPTSRMKAMQGGMPQSNQGQLALRLVVHITPRIRQEINYGPSAGSTEKYLEMFKLSDAAKATNRRSTISTGRLANLSDIRKSLLVNKDAETARRPSKTNNAAVVPIEAKDTSGIARLDSKEFNAMKFKKAIKLLGGALRKIDEDAMEVTPAAESGAVNKMWVRQQIRLALESLEDSKVNESGSKVMFEDNYTQILINAEELDLDQEHVNWLASQYTRDAMPISVGFHHISDTTSTVDNFTSLSHSDSSITNTLSEVTVSTSRRKSLRTLLEGSSSPSGPTAAPQPGAVRRKSLSSRALAVGTSDHSASPTRPTLERMPSDSTGSKLITPPAPNSSILSSPVGNFSSGSLSGHMSTPKLSTPKGRPPPLAETMSDGSGDSFPSLVTSTPPITPNRLAPVSIFSTTHSPVPIHVSPSVGEAPPVSTTVPIGLNTGDGDLPPPPSSVRRKSDVSVEEDDFAPDTLEPVLINGEPPLLNSKVPPEIGYFYEDSEGNVIGPFHVEQLLLWDMLGVLHSQVPIYHGTKLGALRAHAAAIGVGRVGNETTHQQGMRFYPLAAFRKTMCYVLDVKLDEWPIDLSRSFESIEPNSHSIYSHCLAHRFCAPKQVSLQYNAWNFDIWNYAPFELAPLTFLIMSRLRLDRVYNLSAARWRCFIDKVQHLMERHSNPYHNFYHVVDVMQTTYMFIDQMGASMYLKDLDIISLMVGALVHDLDHPGLNNPYQINKRTRLAILYNDISVLENYHIATAFEMISLPDYDIFEGIDQGIRKSIRRIMITCILATDMTVHFQLKGELDAVIMNHFASPKATGSATPVSDVSHSSADSTNLLKDKERDTFLKTLLHLADIGNPTKPWDVSKRWSDLVVQEFFHQGDLEKEEGLPVSANMDRTTTVQDELSINFNDFIVAPYFMAVTTMLPKLWGVCEQMMSNRDKWHDLFEARMTSSELEPLAIEEALAKWRKRKIGFAGQMKSVVDAAIEKLGK